MIGFLPATTKRRPRKWHMFLQDESFIAKITQCYVLFVFPSTQSLSYIPSDTIEIVHMTPWMTSDDVTVVKKRGNAIEYDWEFVCSLRRSPREVRARSYCLSRAIDCNRSMPISKAAVLRLASVQSSIAKNCRFCLLQSESTTETVAPSSYLPTLVTA